MQSPRRGSYYVNTTHKFPNALYSTVQGEWLSRPQRDLWRYFDLLCVLMLLVHCETQIGLTQAAGLSPSLRIPVSVTTTLNGMEFLLKEVSEVSFQRWQLEPK